MQESLEYMKAHRGEATILPWNGGITSGQHKWLKEVLEEIDDVSERCFVACHHPVGTVSSLVPNVYFETASRKLWLRICCRAWVDVFFLLSPSSCAQTRPLPASELQLCRARDEIRGMLGATRISQQLSTAASALLVC
jgi:hypothetical protein